MRESEVIEVRERGDRGEIVVCCLLWWFSTEVRSTSQAADTGKGVLERDAHYLRYMVLFSCCFACAFCVTLATSDMTGVFVCVIVCVQIKPFVTLVTLAADYMDRCFGCVWCCVCGCCLLFCFSLS